ncbi:MAG TPA: hypothetical protein VK326_07690 [Solirubrobacterales bacterium]|nr:hypothetical protein [Solirubrobacterales bacterium]
MIAAGGSGRSTSVIPAVPAASSVTTIAFIRHLPVLSSPPEQTAYWQEPLELHALFRLQHLRPNRYQFGYQSGSYPAIHAAKPAPVAI